MNMHIRETGDPVQGAVGTCQLEGWLAGSRKMEAQPGAGCLLRLAFFIEGKQVSCLYRDVCEEFRPLYLSAGFFRLHGYWQGAPFESQFHIIDIAETDAPACKRMANNLLRSPEKQAGYQLIGLIAELDPPVRQFLESVFSDQALGRAFAVNPASRRYHHDQKGGLLVHSLECALIARRLADYQLNKLEAGLTVAASILHDIAKVRFYTPEGEWTGVGDFVTHEAMALEVISGPLQEFEKEWPIGASLIRHMLTWNKHVSRFPAFPGTLLVRFADHFSTSTHCRDKAFAGLPESWHVAYPNSRDNNKHLRVPTSSLSDDIETEFCDEVKH